MRKGVIILFLLLLSLLSSLLHELPINSQSSEYSEVIRSFVLSRDGIKGEVNAEYTTLVIGGEVTRGYLMKENYSYIEFDLPKYPVISLQAMMLNGKGNIGIGVGSELLARSYYAEVDFNTSTFNLITPSGLVYSTKISQPIQPYQTFTIILDLNNFTAYLFLGNKMIAVVKGVNESVQEEVIYSVSNNAEFLVFQAGSFKNMEILLVQNAISQALNYILGMTTVFSYNGSLYAVTSEYATPSLSFIVYLKNGSQIIFLPGAPDDGYYGFSSTTVDSCYITARNQSIYVTKYEGYCNNSLLFRSYEIISVGYDNFVVIVNFTYVDRSKVSFIYPALANHLISFQQLSDNKFILNISLKYFFPILNLDLYLNSVPAYKTLSWYFHSYRVTFRHVGELMTFLTNESSTLKSLYPYFYNTIHNIQSRSGLKSNGEIISFYAPIFFKDQGNPLLPSNFYDAYNNSWYRGYGTYFAPLAREYIQNGIPPLFYPYKSGAVVINPNYGARDYSLLLNESILVYNSSYNYKYALGLFDPLPLEVLGIWEGVKGNYNLSLLYFNELFGYYNKLKMMCWSFSININNNYIVLFSDYNNNTLRVALALELASILASKSRIGWNYSEVFLNILLSSQWKGFQSTSFSGFQPTFAGGFISATKGNLYSPPRPQIIDQLVLAWGGLNPYNVIVEGSEYPNYIISNAETTIVSIQALAVYLYLKYGIPMEYSINQMFVILYPN